MCKINVCTFEEFYERYYTQVFRYLLKRIGRSQDAEDLASEIFVYCYQHYSSFDPNKSSIGTWLYMIVNSRFKNYCRDRRVNTNYEDLENILTTDDDMDKSIWVSELRAAIANEIKKLPERQQMIVILSYFHKKTSEEIADRLGLSAGNVRVLLSRSLRKMESGLGEFMGNSD